MFGISRFSLNTTSLYSFTYTVIYLKKACLFYQILIYPAIMILLRQLELTLKWSPALGITTAMDSVKKVPIGGCREVVFGRLCRSKGRTFSKTFTLVY